MLNHHCFLDTWIASRLCNADPLTYWSADPRDDHVVTMLRLATIMVIIAFLMPIRSPVTFAISVQSFIAFVSA